MPTASTIDSSLRSVNFFFFCTGLPSGPKTLSSLPFETVVSIANAKTTAMSAKLQNWRDCGLIGGSVT